MVTLAQGLPGDSRSAGTVVRGLTGREEELLAARSGAPMAETVSAVLLRCVTSLGDAAPTAATIRELSVGDRERLLLQVRRATLGDRIDCVATCPNPDCGERLDVTLSVYDLLVERDVERDAAAARWYDEGFAARDGSEISVRFRLPTGGDQEATAEVAATDPLLAAGLLLERCIEPGVGSDGLPAALPEEVVDALGARMAKLDPQAEIRLQFECAVCGRAVEVLFDTASFFFSEVAATAERLYDEVHAIAWHYHWSEQEILDLPRVKRRRYLDLIAGSVGARHARGVA